VTAADPATSLWPHFAAKAELVGARVVQVAGATAAGDAFRQGDAEVVGGTVGHVADVAATTTMAGLAHTASLAQHLPAVAEHAGVRVERGQPQPSEVVALGRLAVAETGSVLLDEPDADRAACFLAERLWVVVPASKLVATLESALERIEELIRGGAHHPQLVTGPSRTADIERTLTVGVHGPRALVVVVLGP
jgi:L-lactate dehydrogenase complex protein LldG